MAHPAEQGERRPRAEQRVIVAARRLRDAQAQLDAERELRDRAITEAIDAGDLSVRAAARAAGLTPSGVEHILARAG